MENKYNLTITINFHYTDWFKLPLFVKWSDEDHFYYSINLGISSIVFFKNMSLTIKNK